MFNKCKEDRNLVYRNMDCQLYLDKVNNRIDKISLSFGVKEIEILFYVVSILCIILVFISKREVRFQIVLF